MKLKKTIILILIFSILIISSSQIFATNTHNNGGNIITPSARDPFIYSIERGPVEYNTRYLSRNEISNYEKTYILLCLD